MDKKKRGFPFPVLILVPVLLVALLTGGGQEILNMLGLIVVILGFYYVIGPYLQEAPSQNRATETMWELEFQKWEEALRDPEKRRRILTIVALAVILFTAFMAKFSDSVILWRAWLLMGLCALGLLALLLDRLLSRRRDWRTAKDRVKYPEPEVNMNYDHEAMADSRVRALQLRLERLEEWHSSGIIDDKEYKELRKKYLGRQDTDV